MYRSRGRYRSFFRDDSPPGRAMPHPTPLLSWIVETINRMRVSAPLCTLCDPLHSARIRVYIPWTPSSYGYKNNGTAPKGLLSVSRSSSAAPVPYGLLSRPLPLDLSFICRRSLRSPLPFDAAFFIFQSYRPSEFSERAVRPENCSC